jgi:hypothetical protein
MTDRFIKSTGEEIFRITDDNKEVSDFKSKKKPCCEKKEKDLSHISDDELIKEFEKRFKSNKED